MRAQRCPSRLLVCVAWLTAAGLCLLAEIGCSRQLPPATNAIGNVPATGKADADWFLPAVAPGDADTSLREFQYELADAEVLPDFVGPMEVAAEFPGPDLVGGGMAGRSGELRDKLLREGGANVRSEAGIAAGLKWLARHQGEDGRWSLDKFHEDGKCNCTGAGQANDVLATGFALLPFLGAGETHKATKKGSVFPKYVERGLKFLIMSMTAEGEFKG